MPLRLTALLMLVTSFTACAPRARTEMRTAPRTSVASTVDSQPGLVTYTSGSVVDVQTAPRGGVLLAGGGTDSPDGMRWLMRQGGERPTGGFGDVVVLRASGADGYHRMLLDLGANSVRSFVITSVDAANRETVRRAIAQAEVIFIAGGDQSRYVKYWAGTALQETVNTRIAAGYPIGGTSAGLAVLSSFVYAAFNVSSTSVKVLASPFDSSVTITPALFRVPMLSNLITDSHFMVRDRMGRLVTFLARLQQDGMAAAPRGIGIDEKSAVGVLPNGTATVFGAGNGANLLSVSSSATRVCAPNTPLSLSPVTATRVPVGSTFNMNTWTAVSASYVLSATRGVLSSSTGAIY